MAEMIEPGPQKGVRKWYQWFSPEDTPEERRVILKLDMMILPIALLSFWIKNMDYGNISKDLISLNLDSTNYSQIMLMFLA